MAEETDGIDEAVDNTGADPDAVQQAVRREVERAERDRAAATAEQSAARAAQVTEAVAGGGKTGAPKVRRAPGRGPTVQRPGLDR